MSEKKLEALQTLEKNDMPEDYFSYTRSLRIGKNNFHYHCEVTLTNYGKDEVKWIGNPAKYFTENLNIDARDWNGRKLNVEWDK